MSCACPACLSQMSRDMPLFNVPSSALSAPMCGKHSCLSSAHRSHRCRMLDREELATSRPRRLHPLLVEVECFGGERLYYSEWTGHVCTEPTFDTDTVRGGVLCDEMGLGKTVELLHLILSRQRGVESLDPVPPSSHSLPAPQSNASKRSASPLAPSPSSTSKKARTSPTTLTHATAAAPHCLCKGALVEVWCEVSDIALVEVWFEVSGMCAIGSGALGSGGAAGNESLRAAAKAQTPAPPALAPVCLCWPAWWCDTACQTYTAAEWSRRLIRVVMSPHAPRLAHRRRKTITGRASCKLSCPNPTCRPTLTMVEE